MLLLVAAGLRPTQSFAQAQTATVAVNKAALMQAISTYFSMQAEIYTISMTLSKVLTISAPPSFRQQYNATFQGHHLIALRLANGSDVSPTDPGWMELKPIEIIFRDLRMGSCFPVASGTLEYDPTFAFPLVVTCPIYGQGSSAAWTLSLANFELLGRNQEKVSATNFHNAMLKKWVEQNLQQYHYVTRNQVFGTSATFTAKIVVNVDRGRVVSAYEEESGADRIPSDFKTIPEVFQMAQFAINVAEEDKLIVAYDTSYSFPHRIHFIDSTFPQADTPTFIILSLHPKLQENKKFNWLLVIFFGVIILIVLVLVALFVFYWWRRNQQRKKEALERARQEPGPSLSAVGANGEIRNGGSGSGAGGTSAAVGADGMTDDERQITREHWDASRQRELKKGRDRQYQQQQREEYPDDNDAPAAPTHQPPPQPGQAAVGQRKTKQQTQRKGVTFEHDHDDDGDNNNEMITLQ